MPRLLEAIQAFFQVVPWDQVAAQSQVDKDFFKPDAVKFSSSWSLLTLENEMGIDGNWPLATILLYSLTLCHSRHRLLYRQIESELIELMYVPSVQIC